MGIDGIGGGGGPPKVGGEVSPVQRRDGERFQLPADGVGTGEVQSSEGAELLDKVQQGEVSLDEYLDVRVSEAVSHLKDALPPEQLDFIKAELRGQLQEDPVLIELVRQTTGQSSRA